MDADSFHRYLDTNKLREGLCCPYLKNVGEGAGRLSQESVSPGPRKKNVVQFLTLWHPSGPSLR
jgi:hypothetical protein